MDITIFFGIIILIMSVVIHEVAHGYAAFYLGDETANYEGRLTLNPLKHLDPFGSVILPFLLSLIPGGVIFGWAKPVPYNPYNLRNRRWGEMIVAIAGPLSNLFIAIFFSVLIRLQNLLNLSEFFIEISLSVVIINVILMVFNLVPIPPLDGSKVLFGLFPRLGYELREKIERFGFVFLLVFILFLWQFIIPIVFKIVSILANVG